MAIRYKCPVCGSLAWASTLDRSFSLETYNQKSLGKAHGFKPVLVEDPILIERIKNKILALYLRFKLFIRVAPELKIQTDPSAEILADDSVSVAEIPTIRTHFARQINGIRINPMVKTFVRGDKHG